MSKKMNSPDQHWLDMPDFEQEKVEPYACINIRFSTEQDLIAFMEKTGLLLTKKTKSAWFPSAQKKDTGFKRWI